MKIIKAEGYGLANIELNIAARPDTVYKIGSVSKQFIATGIMLLIEDGKISLNDPIGKFLERKSRTWKEIHHPASADSYVWNRPRGPRF